MLHDNVSACPGIGEKVMVSPKSITCQAKVPDDEIDQAAMAPIKAWDTYMEQ